jgi:hypothetical protein
LEDFVDSTLMRYLREAWRGDLAARRHLLQHLHWLGLPGLTAVLRPALGPDVVHLDAWALGQIAAAVGLSEQEMDDIMPWRCPATAAAAISRTLQTASGEPWHVHVRQIDPATLVIRSPRERLDAAGHMPEQERVKLARILNLDTSRVQALGLECSTSMRDLCEFVARAEDREVVYDLTVREP